MPTDAERAPGPRLQRPGALVFVIALGVAIFFVARGCQSEGIDLSQEEALAIARQQIEYVPDQEQIRILRRGISSKPHWVVGFERRDESGDSTDVTTVVIDAETGEVVEVRVDGREVPIRGGPE